MPPSDGVATSTGPPSAAPGESRRSRTSGILFGIGAYGLWGFLPVYFVALQPAGPVEIVANRVVWSMVFCAVLITAARGWPAVMSVLGNRGLMFALTGAAMLIGVNWLIYTVGVTTGHAIETALGYFINPLLSVLLGVVLLHERLRPLQWTAVAISAVAVVLLTITYGRIPWIALGLALSFGFYGFVKKTTGPRVDALSSFSVETMTLLPVAAGVMVWLAVTGQSTLLSAGSSHFWLMASSGVITALPLLFFGAAARRLPLSTIGLLQYLTPTLQFIFALTVLREPMPPERWVGFGLVWLALAVLTVDMFRATRRIESVKTR